VILALVDVTGEDALDMKPEPLPDYIYFSVDDVEAFHERARELNVFRLKTCTARAPAMS
jgi:hypothetical protein